MITRLFIESLYSVSFTLQRKTRNMKRKALILVVINRIIYEVKTLTFPASSIEKMEIYSFPMAHIKREFIDCG